MADLTTQLSKFLVDLASGQMGTSVTVNTVRLTPTTFANLPGSPSEGTLAAVTDGSTATWGATLSGSGSNHVLAYYDGTNWTVAGQ